MVERRKMIKKGDKADLEVEKEVDAKEIV